jgi:BlaI family transcriptional regulator, penicillinase repressor
MRSRPQPPKPTDAELEILNVLWTLGPATVRQVYEEINSRRSVQYSTILKFMQIMAGKRILVRDDSERAHVYKAAQSREATQQQLAAHLLERAFSGSAKDLVLRALSATKASKTELSEIRRLLDDYAKEKK